ncbi:phage tail tape measure protein [Anaerosalibacter bizertensis]|uniref:phage tail tape measure protein n=1 Tax=Anaerosalibacter bizertensis TaxID=932217 RepID=UPI001C0F25DF|nr:phage tail tape measure protein [Anaerosalibacter bizertensis]MBU5293127.1 phage tail tape measure protein [Anaerosalibacter bizertensis]
MAKDQVEISFKVFNEDFNRAMREMREDTTRLNREFRLQKEQMRLSGSETDKLKASVNYLSERYKQAQQRVKETSEQLERAKAVYGENSEEVKKLEGQLINAQVQEQRFANELEIANKKLKEAQDPTIQYGKSLQNIGEKMQSVGEKATALGGKLTTKLTLPIIGVGTASAKMSMTFEENMAKIGTLIPGQSERIKELENDIKNVAITTGKSTDDIADGTYNVISAFGDAEDTMEKVEINAKAAAAGVAETTDALNLSSAVMKGYGDTTAEANQKVMDLAFETLRLGQTSFPELASSMGKVIPTSNELGISQEELFAVFATGTGVTGNASEVSTQYQGVLKALMAPTKEMTALMQEMGYEDGQAMIAKEGLGGAIQIVVDKAKESGTPLQKYIGSIQGQVLALALAGEQSDVYADKLEQLKDSEGAMDKAFKETSDTTAFTWAQAMEKMKIAAIEMGEALAPVVAKIADGIGKLADKFRELSPEQKESIIKFLGLIAAIGPVLKIFGPLLTLTGKLTSGFGGFMVNLGKAGSVSALLAPKLGALKTGFSVLTGPVGIAIALVAAFAFAAYKIITNWDTVGPFLKEIWEGIKNIFFTSIEFIGNLIETVWTAIATFFITVWEVITIPFQFIWELIKSIVISAMSIIEAIIGTVLAVIQVVWQVIWGFIGQYVTAVWESIKTVVTVSINAVKTVITSVMNAIKTIITTIWNAIKSVTFAVWNVIKGVITSIVNAIKAVITTVFNAIKSVVTTIWNGVKSVTSSVWNGIRSTITSIVNAIKSVVTSVFNTIKSVTTTIWNAIKTAMTRPVEAAKNKIKSILDTIKGFFSRLKLKFPKIEMPPLPHFRLTGKFSLKPPETPKLRVDWRSQGGIFKTPTILPGGIGVGDAYRGIGGKAEVVAPLSTLLSYIKRAVPQQTAEPVVVNNINFNGNYGFRDEDDIDYFMKKAAELIRRERN